MSNAKRVKLETQGESDARANGAEIVVNLGNGRSARLRTRGPEGAVIQAGRWRQFRDELSRSEFWQRRREDSADDEYDEVAEREIQRAWDDSGRADEQHSMDGPDIPLDDTRPALRLAELAQGTGEKRKGGGGGGGGEKEGGSAMNGGRGGMQRYLVTVEYAGTRFLGWQKQTNRPDLRTVQGALEAAFHKFVGQPVACAGSSRTDTGVHALANVCHVDVERISKRKPGEVLPPHAPDVVKRAVNHFLQKDDGGDMAVVNVRTVPENFHARFRATERTYYYRMLSGGAQPSIFEKDRAWQVPETLNLPAMQEACQVLLGNHDFSSFRAAGCQAKSPVKTLDELHVCEMSAFPTFPTSSDRAQSQSATADTDELQNWHGHPNSNELRHSAHSVHMNNASRGRLESDCAAATASRSKTPRCFVITTRARSFLYHQVRLMVGTLKAVGCGVLNIDDVRSILAAKSINATPAMAPACGLYLAEVQYDFSDIDSGNAVDEFDASE